MSKRSWSQIEDIGHEFGVTSHEAKIFVPGQNVSERESQQSPDENCNECDDSVEIVSVTFPREAHIFVDLEDETGHEVENGGSQLTKRIPNANLLIPPRVPDEKTGSFNFIYNYSVIYGCNMPAFYKGTFLDAAKEALFQSSNEKRLLGIYLHHARSNVANAFCRGVFQKPEVLKILSDYFVIWGWDVSDSSNKKMYLESAGSVLGRTISDTTKRLSKNRYPVFLAVSRFRSLIERRMVVFGTVGEAEFMKRLADTVEKFSSLQISREKGRRNKNQLRKTYSGYFETDRAKARLKRKK